MVQAFRKNASRFQSVLRWFLRRWSQTRGFLFERKKGVLVYVGLHKGREFDLIFQTYRECYGFEANPELFDYLKEKYKSYPGVKIFNYAAATHAGQVSFNISSNNGASSSLGSFEESWPNARSGDITMVKTIVVPSINLGDFFRDRGVTYINDYISDIQGMDLEVLKTMKWYIDERKIGTITVETTRDERRNIYKDLPDNSESGFRALLQANYKLVATGYGLLPDYWFNEVSEDTWEIDCKWRRRILRRS